MWCFGKRGRGGEEGTVPVERRVREGNEVRREFSVSLQRLI